MKEPNHTEPPKWASKFLGFFVKTKYLEEIMGDMEEIFQYNCQQFSPNRAKRMYVLELLKLLRPILLRNVLEKYHLNQYGILKSNFKTSFRNIKKNKLFSSINIIGIAIGMSVGILMILFLLEIYSFDDFQAQKDTMYRVTSTRTINGREGKHTTASFYIGEQLENKVPGVEKVLILGRDMSADLKAMEKTVPISGYYAPSSFFDFFSFKLIYGNPETALSGTNGIVLTASVAQRLFGDVNPMGQSVTTEDNPNFPRGTVTGVMEDPPMNSHMQFEALLPLQTLEGQLESGNLGTNPAKLYEGHVYVLLNTNTKKKDVEATMEKIMAKYNSGTEPPIVHKLQPSNTFVTSDAYINETGPTFSKAKIYLMIGLTIIVLFSACFNYANLSLARALRRAKEIGVRKVSGASRSQVFIQFIMEATMLSLIALVIGLGLFFIIRPEFIGLPNPTSRGYQMFSLEIKYFHLLYFLLFALCIGCISGFLPAVLLSKLKAKVIFLKDAGKVNLFSGIRLRRVLIVFQFALSIGLITCAILIRQQYQFAINYDLGYATAQIVNIRIQGDYAMLLEEEYRGLSEVEKTSKSSVILGVGAAEVGMAESENRKEKAPFLMNQVDQKYFDMHQFTILAGSTFLDPVAIGESADYAIVNESFLKGLNLGSPQEAIGKYIWFRDTKLQILGVVANFVNIALNVQIMDSFVFLQPDSPSAYRNLGVRVKGDNFKHIMQSLERGYKKMDPVNPFDASFYDDKIARAYQTEKTSHTIISFLAFLAISISALGLLGMVVFTAETKIKEISIRKVLGASIRNLTLLLSRSFLIMMLIAGSIAIPLTLYIVDHKILNEYSHRAEIGFFEVFSGLFIVLALGTFIIGWQIRKAVVQNPVNLLRNE